MFSGRYLHAVVKMLDGMPAGSSSLWASRGSKGYGSLPGSRDPRPLITEVIPTFDYSFADVAAARFFRSNFYERILSPKEIPIALQYGPVTLDVEIYDSAWTDQGGVLTLPDEDNKKEDLDHTMMVYGHDEHGLKVDTNWSNWGNKGHGFISYEYLDKHFLTAFILSALYKLGNNPQRELSRKKIKIKNSKWYEHTYAVPSMKGDKRPLFNVEIYTTGGLLSGWIHFAQNRDESIEVLDLFVLPESRRQGVGTHLLQKAQALLRTGNITGYIASHDLGKREEIVKDFLLSNNLLPYVDTSQFRDCRFRIGRLDSF